MDTLQINSMTEHVVENLHEARKSPKCDGSLIQELEPEDNVEYDTKEKLFQCKLCHKSFNYSRNLLKHMKIHTGEKPYRCDICHKFFRQKGDLVKHGKVHTGEKPYKCPECEKLYTQKISLVYHMRIHGGEKPFRCSECNKSFVQKGDVVKHMKVHTGEKPFSCSECHKSFGHKGDLIKHLKVHTGEKPYECSKCYKTFTQKGHLIRHMKVHTGENISEKELHDNASVWRKEGYHSSVASHESPHIQVDRIQLPRGEVKVSLPQTDSHLTVTDVKVEVIDCSGEGVKSENFDDLGIICKSEDPLDTDEMSNCNTV